MRRIQTLMTIAESIRSWVQVSKRWLSQGLGVAICTIGNRSLWRRLAQSASVRISALARIATVGFLSVFTGLTYAQTWIAPPSGVSCDGITSANQVSPNPIEQGRLMTVTAATAGGGQVFFYRFEVVGSQVRLHIRGVDAFPPGTGVCFPMVFDTSVLQPGTYEVYFYDYFEGLSAPYATPLLIRPYSLPFRIAATGSLTQRVPGLAWGAVLLIATLASLVGLRKLKQLGVANRIRVLILCSLLAPPLWRIHN